MMSNRGSSEDAATLLYLVPFAASGLYGLYLWLSTGISAVLPSSVYLTVTRDPIVFVIGSLSVMLGAVIELSAVEPAGRPAKLNSLGNTMQTIAGASLVLTLFFALYANSFDITGAATDFIVGRFGLVFPAMLVLLSYLVTARFNISALMNRKPLGILLMLLVPASVYVLGKRSVALGLGAALVLVIVALALFLMPIKEQAEPEQV